MNRDKDMKKAVLFPYENDLEYIVKNRSIIKDISLVGLLSLPGFGNINSHVICSDRSFVVYDDIDIISEETDIDVLLVVQGNRKCDFGILYEKCETAAAMGVSIWSSICLTEEEYEIILLLCGKYGVEFKKLNDISEPQDFFSKALPEIHTPIIAVTGMGERCNQLAIQIELFNRLCKKGYTISGISSIPMDLFEGIHPLPQYMIGHQIDEQSKIINYSHLVKQIEQDEKPDAIVISVPEGIMPLTRKRTGNFGITAYEIFNAVSPDFTILSLYQDSYQDKYFDEINRLLSYRFNIEADCFYMRALSIDKFSVNLEMPLKYVNADIESNKELCSKYEHKVFHESDYEGIVNYMIFTLENYERIEVI